MLRIFVILAVVGVIVGIYWGVQRRNDKLREIWSEFADEHGLTLAASGFETNSEQPVVFEVSGRYRGESISIGYEQHRGDRTAYWGYLESEAPVDLELFRMTAYHRFGKLFGRPDIEIGHGEFDDAFVVRGTDEEAIREFLNRPAVIDGLLRLDEVADEIDLSRGRLFVRTYGRADAHEQLDTYATALSGALSALNNTAKPGKDDSDVTTDDERDEPLEKHADTW